VGVDLTYVATAEGWLYLCVVIDLRVRQSMSRKGDCWDNAVAEALCKTLKSELTGYRAYRSRAEARRAIFEYIERFYNRLRLHSTIGYVSPSEFEESHGRVAA
jgi:transposase InsO family protein